MQKNYDVLLALKDAYKLNEESIKAAEICMKLAELTDKISIGERVELMREAVNLDCNNEELFHKVEQFLKDERLLVDLVSLLFDRMKNIVKGSDSALLMIQYMQSMITAISDKVDKDYSNRIYMLEEQMDLEHDRIEKMVMLYEWQQAADAYLIHIPREFKHPEKVKSRTINTKNNIKSLFYMGNDLVVVGHLNSGIEIWNIVNNQRIIQFGILENMNDVWALGVVGDFVVCASDDRSGFCLFNIGDGRLVNTIPTSSKICTGRRNLIGFGNKYVVAGLIDKTIQLYDISHTEPECIKLRGHTGWVSCLEYGPNGRLISGSNDGTIRIWNLNSLECEMILTGSDNAIFCMALIDEQTLASSDGNQIRIWDLRSGENLGILVGHTDDVNQIVALGNLVASCSDDKKIIFWDILKFEAIHMIEEHTSYIFNLISIPHNKLISSDDAGMIKIWSVSV